jgi:hypothetical protein
MNFDRALAVKERHEDALLKNEFVQGVGVSEHSGRPAIVIYVDRDQGPGAREIPDSIEGVPVVVETSGRFTTL